MMAAMPSSPSSTFPHSTTPFDGLGALVTGGGSGIGLAAARLLVVAGAHVTLMGRSGDRLAAAAAELHDELPDAASVAGHVGDVSNEADVIAAVGVAKAATGKLGVVVASAGMGAVAPIVAQPLEEFQAVIATNLVGTFLTIKHGGAALAASGGGSIVAVSSLAACTVHAWMSAYAASKAGIDALVRNAADELGASGVRVNSVQPSLVETELVAIPMGDPDLLTSYMENMPIARVGQPDDVASVIRFLAGPESGWMTGNNLPVDGGHHLRRGPDYGGITRFLYGDSATEPGYTGA